MCVCRVLLRVYLRVLRGDQLRAGTIFSYRIVSYRILLSLRIVSSLPTSLSQVEKYRITSQHSPNFLSSPPPNNPNQKKQLSQSHTRPRTTKSNLASFSVAALVLLLLLLLLCRRLCCLEQ
ncbi:hypothetical protein L211DRAFT_238446 [Terfezia boudieri ATCC MYA-4762]|uniref:Uncharacterized protein n=1 Tax=Terfezia boudieri ATCC MYA-4762 TaxID=1051890 RepID=A0A3N4M197_9PEZI|nr:hypothetical protein L211DRAFT_238446 [Terfezia boudieri ATCC MYA-4762]